MPLTQKQGQEDRRGMVTDLERDLYGHARCQQHRHSIRTYCRLIAHYRTFQVACGWWTCGTGWRSRVARTSATEIKTKSVRVNSQEKTCNLLHTFGNLVTSLDEVVDNLHDLLEKHTKGQQMRRTNLGVVLQRAPGWPFKHKPCCSYQSAACHCGIQ
jgi:hypothetical protein